MANKKITELPELTTPANGDFIYIVDVSDLTESAEGTSKKIKKSNLAPTTPDHNDLTGLNAGDYQHLTVAEKELALATPTIDATPTDGSTNAVQSNGVFDALALKVDKYIKSNESLALAQRKDDVLYGILDQYTGEEITLSKITGTPTVDGVIYFQLGSEYFKRNNIETINPKWFGAKLDGITDDTVAMQNCMPINGGNVYVDGICLITNPFTIYSNTHLEFSDNSTIQLQSGLSSRFMLQNNAAINFDRTLADGSATINTSIITSASANFTSADIGKSITLFQGGCPQTATGDGLPSPTNPKLYARIVSVNSSTSITIDANIYANVTNQTLIIYKLDANIKISGGVWDKKNVLSSTLQLRRIKGLTIENISLKSAGQPAGGNYAVSLGDVDDVVVDNCIAETYSDGFHLVGGFNNVVLKNLKGITGDDFISVTSRDWYGAGRDVHEIYGNGNGLYIDNITGASLTGVVRIEGADSTYLDNINIKNISPDLNSGGIILDNSVYYGFTDLRNIIIDNISGNIIPTARTPIPISILINKGGNCYVSNIHINDNVLNDEIISVGTPINGGVWDFINIDNVEVISKVSITSIKTSSFVTINKLYLKNINLEISNNATGRIVVNNAAVSELILSDSKFINNNTSGFGGFVFQNSIKDIQNLYFENISIINKTLSNLESFDFDKNIKNVFFNNINLDFINTTSASLFIKSQNCTIDSITISNTVVNGINKVFNFLNTALISNIFINNYKLNVSGRVFGDIACPNLSLYLNNCLLESSSSLASIYLYSNAVLKIFGDGVKINGNTTGVQRASTENITVKNKDFPVDVSICTNTNGSIAYNTNSGLTCGVGLVANDGVGWFDIVNGSKSKLGTRTTNATTTGTYNVDWNAGDVWQLTLTGATTITDSNLPTGTATKVIELMVKGAFSITLPAYWEATPSSGTYDGSKWNHFVISCINGTTSSEKVIYSNEVLAT